MSAELQKKLLQGRFGLEKEGLRVNKYTLLPSVSDHPFGPDPNISRDFCEAQTEIITPVYPDTDGLFAALHDLNERVKAVLAQRDEILWNYSNPPAGYDVRKIRIAHFEGPEKEKEEYRKYLREKYGIPVMLLSGIHFNFSFTKQALETLAGIDEISDTVLCSTSAGMTGNLTRGLDMGSSDALFGAFSGGLPKGLPDRLNSRSHDGKTGDFSGGLSKGLPDRLNSRSHDGKAVAFSGGLSKAFSDSLYLKIAASAMKYAWLITYLTAASPEPDFQDPVTKKPEGFASIRCSRHGYWNDFTPVLDYTSLASYVDSIQALVDAGKLYSAWELYLPVRLKPEGTNTLESLRKGVSHIELRMLDINPLAPDGIRKEDVDFLHLLLLMWALQESGPFDADAQRRAVRNMQRASLLNADSIWIEDPKYHLLPVKKAALDFLEEMDRFYEAWQAFWIHDLIRFERNKILDPRARYAERILDEYASCFASRTADR